MSSYFSALELLAMTLGNLKDMPFKKCIFDIILLNSIGKKKI